MFSENLMGKKIPIDWTGKINATLVSKCLIITIVSNEALFLPYYSPCNWYFILIQIRKNSARIFFNIDPVFEWGIEIYVESAGLNCFPSVLRIVRLDQTLSIWSLYVSNKGTTGFRGKFKPKFFGGSMWHLSFYEYFMKNTHLSNTC